MSWPPPLRYLIPAMLMLFASTAAFITVRYGRDIEQRYIEDRFRERAQFLGTKLSGMSAYFIESNNLAGAQRSIALAAADRDLRTALVADSSDRVIFGTRYEFLNRPLKETPLAPMSDLFERVRLQRSGIIELTPDRNSLHAVFPFPITRRVGGSLRDSEYGVVFLDFNLLPVKTLSAASNARRLWVGGIVLFGLTIVFSLIFQPLLMSRVRRFARAASRLAGGDLSARTGLTGADELAELARSFDRMAADLQRGNSELRESEARFRFLVEGIPQVFWLDELDPYRPLYVAPAFERLWGCKREDFYTSPELWSERIHPEDRAHAKAAYLDWIEGRADTYDVTFRIVRPDLTESWVRNRGTLFSPDPGGRRRVVGIAEDITVQHRLEDERNELERKLQETQKLESLGVLAGGIAHDFNNLLTGILGNASLARAELNPLSPAHPHLEQIEAVAQRAADLCKQMLAYSGKGRFQVRRLDLSVLVRETTDLIRLSIDKTAVLRFNLTEPLPPVEADATQIRQIIMNLVINAGEALGGKSGVITINTGIVHADRTYLEKTVLSPDLPTGDYAYLEVCDDGCGMTPEQQARIFEPFFTTKFAGRGLGLSAVLGIVRGHHGALRVYSEPDKGTTFKVIFPVASGEADPITKDGIPATEWSGAGAILIVDDEQTVRTVASRMVEKMGFSAVTAVDGREGVEKFKTHQTEIVAVLMDLTMPQMDGETAFRELRAIAPDARVILMSGFNEQDAINRFTGKGLAGFIQKPFRPDALRKKLRDALDPVVE